MEACEPGAIRRVTYQLPVPMASRVTGQATPDTETGRKGNWKRVFGLDSPRIGQATDQVWVKSGEGFADSSRTEGL